jgi:hypothetical protein
VGRIEKDMRVDLVEQMVMRPPKGMEKWRNYRIEYGGHAQYCVVEGIIWARQEVDPCLLEEAIERLVNNKEIKCQR